MKKPCEQCGAEINLPEPIDALTARLAKLVTVCYRCEEVKRKRDNVGRWQAIQNERSAAWAEICPPAYQNTDPAKLPNPKKLAEVMAWTYQPRGLLMHGETRRGKSRCAWKLCEREFMAGRSVRVLDSMAGIEYAGLFGEGADKAERWVKEHSRCGLLFMDDAFKAKLTDSFEAAVFAVIDYRLGHQLPIIATLNDTGATLAGRMSGDRGAALVARLKEMCGVIEF